MLDDDRPTQPEEDPATAEPPPVVNWMMQQAAAGQTAATGQLPVAGGTWLALAPVPTEAALIARERRIVDALRGNERLTEGLDGEVAEALLGLGLELGRVVVHDTAGSDDAGAEEILQSRVRAVRRLMLAVNEASQQPESALEINTWMGQVTLALADRFSQPDETETAAFERRWRLLAGQPLQQIAALRRLIEDHTGRQP